jgi:NTE family protein
MDIALALGGGGFKAVAHIGVIDRLENHGFRIRAIAGTSAGGLIGAAYAAGNSPLEILKAVQNLDPTKLYRRHNADGPSILGHAGLVEIITTLVGQKLFTDLKIPFGCTAVDLNSSREVYLREGKVIDAAEATMAIPGVLPPTQAGSVLLVDGAVLDPVPVTLARILAPDLPIVAVPLTPAGNDWDKIPPQDVLATSTLPFPLPGPILQSFSRMRIGQAIRIFYQSLEISSMMVTELRLKIDKPDVIIRPVVYSVGLFELANPLQMVAAGRDAVDDQLVNLRRETSWRGRVDRFFRQISPVNEPDVLRHSASSAFLRQDGVRKE